MKHHLFDLLAGLSLILCATTVGLWVRSYSVEDAFAIRGPGKELPYQYATLISQHGELAYEQKETKRITVWPPATGYFRSWEGIRDVSGPQLATAPPQVANWNFGVIEVSSSATGRYVSVSLMFLSMLWATLPAIYLCRSVLQKRKPHLGLCSICGYDLKGTPDRCPECGTISKTAKR